MLACLVVVFNEYYQVLTTHTPCSRHGVCVPTLTESAYLVNQRCEDRPRSHTMAQSVRQVWTFYVLLFYVRCLLIDYTKAFDTIIIYLLAIPYFLGTFWVYPYLLRYNVGYFTFSQVVNKQFSHVVNSHSGPLSSVALFKALV